MMIRNYIKIAFRNLVKAKAFSFINIFGLAAGLTCFMLIAAFVTQELSYDRYPKDAKNIYRVLVSVTGNGKLAVYPDVDVAVGKGMQQTFPEVKSFARVVPETDFIKYKDKEFKEQHLAFADSNFLQMFSIPLIEGNGSGALVQPNSMVISKAFAQRYFGSEDPMGKMLVLGTQGNLFKVTGVFDIVPDRSHFHFDAFFSLSTWHIVHETWSNIGIYTYLELQPNADPKKLEKKFPQLVARYVVPEVQHDMGISVAEAEKSVNTFIFSLQPLTKIHLYSHTKYELETNGDIQYVTIFFVLAIFILLLACVNFTNLSTARAIKRAKEVGIRKVLGSLKKQLIFQFLAESVVYSFFAMLCAFALIFALLPYFNELSARHIRFSYFLHFPILPMMCTIALFMGMLAGLYPAFFLASFAPIKVLKGSTGFKTGGRNTFRRGLIVFQFLVSTRYCTSRILNFWA
jgi:putative ABC transport system permease protein